MEKFISKEFDWGGAFGARWMGLNVPWGNLWDSWDKTGPGPSASFSFCRLHSGCFNEDIVQVF